MSRRHALLVLAFTAAIVAAATVPLQYSAEAVCLGSTGDFAPYMIGSWQHGKYVQKWGAALDVMAEIPADTSRRFSWSAGVEALISAQSAASYEHYDAATELWSLNNMRPSPLRLQQAWGEIRYRGCFLQVGMRNSRSLIMPENISSGDIVLSNNARPIPAVSIGFNDFQNIPFTNGWVQIRGEITYGKMMDNGFREGQYNWYNYLIARTLGYTYKYCYFRTNPNQPLCVTVGMQAAGMFAGSTEWYTNGQMYRSDNRGFNFRDIIDMFVPSEGNDGSYYKGNSLGSWSLRADWISSTGHELAFYFEWPWEDGSGIGRLNGWDGVWGIEYRPPESGAVTAVVAEYIDFTNHSGPFHWAPNDHPGTTITGSASGGDNYYNNDVYGPWANYGMAIGSPFIMAPVYNLDGFQGFARNRARGFHLGVEGRLHPCFDYRVMFSGQWAWGFSRIPQARAASCISGMGEIAWHQSPDHNGWSVRLQVALDSRSLRGENTGVLLGVRYQGDLSKRKDPKPEP